MITEKGPLNPKTILKAVELSGDPQYLYSEAQIIEKCQTMLSMPNAYGLRVHYAMKANSNRALLQIITEQGLDLDVSTLNEARRAHLAGVPYERMMLTSQEVQLGQNMGDLQEMIKQGLTYNVCSSRQLNLIADFASKEKIPLSIRVNPGAGSGETRTRNTGDKYASFGIYVYELEDILKFAKEKNITFNQVHVHIGSGADPLDWRENINRELEIIENYFPDAETVNLGGGFKVARMPDEEPADVHDLGHYAQEKFETFYQRTGRKLKMAIEPGSVIVANAGYLITRVMDEKWSGPDGFEFIILNAGMNANTRPLLYGSRHPFYIISKNAKLMSSEFNLEATAEGNDLRLVCGPCCESGDSQSIDLQGHVTPRMMADPDVDDYVVIGGTGAYCSAMSLVNYNSIRQLPEILLRKDGTLKVIRKQQTLEQMLENEVGL